MSSAFKLKALVREQEISSKILEALDEHSGIYKPLDAAARKHAGSEGRMAASRVDARQ